MASNAITPPGVPGSGFNFDDAPGGDVNFDDLFPGVDGNAAQPTTADPGTPSDPTPAPQEPVAPLTPAQEEFLLRAGDTVYKSKEDAERGIAYKDSVIEQLRQRFIFEHGVDPLTNRPIDLPGTYGPQAQPQSQAQAKKNYLQDSQSYFEDLVNAVQSEDHNAYMQAQAKLVFDILEPLAPVISEITKDRAVQSLNKEIKDFGDFVGSEAYRGVLSEQPALSEAIQMAEQDYRMYGQLPGLYKLAYWASQGRRLPELLKAAQQPTAPAPSPARPLTRPSTQPPPAPSAKPDFRTHEGRQAMMRELEARGIADMKL